jgi:hypothetical protein
MTLRGRFLLVAGGWLALALVLQTAIPLAYKSQLPDPVATHWGLTGAPNGAMPFWAHIATLLGLWALFAAILLIGIARSRVERRPRRQALAAMTAAAGVFVVGMSLAAVDANLNAPDWQHAKPLNWQIIAVLAVSVLAGAIGWRVGSPGPDVRTAAAGHPPSMSLKPYQKAVWFASASNPLMVGVALTLLPLAVMMSVGAIIGVPWLTWRLVLPLAVLGLVFGAVSSVRTRITDRGLAIGFGPFGWPVRHIAVGRIESAWSEHRRPMEVGGWGIRGLPGGSTIMIRGGETLVIRYTTGGELGVSADDAERGAALLNTLVAQRAGRSAS